MWHDRQHEGIKEHPYYIRGGVSVGSFLELKEPDCRPRLPDWECAYCGMDNEGHLRRCPSCGAPKTKPRPPEPRYSPALQAAIFATPAMAADADTGINPHELPWLRRPYASLFPDIPPDTRPWLVRCKEAVCGWFYGVGRAIAYLFSFRWFHGEGY